ncbi:MAG: hypothetical protein HY543_00415 [Deltaproteobacteria bacterium]|nr:hypothetical protein [Deltaproteobacteria bacterium]
MACRRRHLTSTIGLLLGYAMCIGCSQGSADAPALSSMPSAPATVTPPTVVAGSGSRQAKLTYQIGPFDLPAGTAAEAMREQPGKVRFRVDEPMWVTAFEPRIEDGDGAPLPGSLLHLAIIANHAETNPLCTAKQMGNPFAAATASLKQITLPPGSGYAVLPDDPLSASVILHNPSEQDYHNVYFTFTLTAEPLKTAKTMTDVAPLLLDMDPCDHAPLAIEPNGYVKKSQQFNLPETGRLMQAYGLLQHYGVEIALGKESADKPFWKAAAMIDAEHQIVSLPAFDDPSGVAVNQGDPIHLSVAYDNVQERWLTDATAAAMVYVARVDTTDGATATTKPLRKTAMRVGQVQSLLIQSRRETRD